MIKRKGREGKGRIVWEGSEWARESRFSQIRYRVRRGGRILAQKGQVYIGTGISIGTVSVPASASALNSFSFCRHMQLCFPLSRMRFIFLAVGTARVSSCRLWVRWIRSDRMDVRTDGRVRTYLLVFRGIYDGGYLFRGLLVSSALVGAWQIVFLFLFLFLCFAWVSSSTCLAVAGSGKGSDVFGYRCLVLFLSYLVCVICDLDGGWCGRA